MEGSPHSTWLHRCTLGPPSRCNHDPSSCALASWEGGLVEGNPNLCSRCCDMALMLLWLSTSGMFVWRGLATVNLFLATSSPTCVGSRLLGPLARIVHILLQSSLPSVLFLVRELMVGCTRMCPLTHMQYGGGQNRQLG